MPTNLSRPVHPGQEPKPSLVLYILVQDASYFNFKQTKHFTIMRHRRRRLRRVEILTFILYTLLTAYRLTSLVLYVPGRNQNPLSSCTSSCRTSVILISKQAKYFTVMRHRRRRLRRGGVCDPVTIVETHWKGLSSRGMFVCRRISGYVIFAVYEYFKENQIQDSSLHSE